MAIEKKKVIDIDTKKAQTGVRNLREEIRELRNAMAGMEEGSEEWAQASQKLAAALDQQRKIAEAGKFATQDYGNMLGNLSSVGAGVVAGINGVTSALSLMGVEMNKDDVGMIKFTQSMMAIVQALASVDTATKAWDGLMTGLNAMLDQKIADTAATAANTAATEANTAASTKNAAAKTGQATAIGATTTAFKGETVAAAAGTKTTTGLAGAFTKLAAALKMSKAALGIIGVALAAVGAIATVVIKHFKNLREEQEKTQAEATKWETDSANAAAEAITKYEFLRKSFVDTKAAGESLTKWVKDHKKELKDLNMENSTMNQLEDAFINRTSEYVDALTKRYVAQWKLKAAQDEYIANLKDINAFQTLLDTFGVPNSRSEKYTLTINGEQIKKTYGEWLDASNRAKFNNDRLMESLSGLTKELQDADNVLKEFGVTTNTNTTAAKQWSNEIQQLKDNINGLSDNIITTSAKLENAYNVFTGKLSTFNEQFKETTKNILNSNNTVLSQYNILSQDTLEWFDKIGKEGENIEAMFSNLFKGVFQTTTDDLEVFTNTVNGIGTLFTENLTGGTSMLEKIDKLIERLRTNTSTINTNNLFDDEQFQRFLQELSGLETEIGKVQGEYNSLANKTGAMTEAEEAALKVKEKTLARLKSQYAQLKAVAEAYQGIMESYREQHDAQLQLMEDYEKLAKRLANFNNELEKGTEWRYEDRVRGIRDEIAAEQELIETLKEQINQFPPNAQKRIELENSILDHLVSIRQKEREITQLTYEENLKAFEQYINEQEYLYDYSLSKQKEKANLLGLGVEDYNAALEAIQFELDMEQNKFNKLEEMRKLNLISEQEYESRRIEMLRTFKDLELRMEEEKSNRKLKIFSTYYNGVKSITNAINGILSAAIEAEEGNKEKQKELRIAQTWMTGIMGSIEALVSGIQSGIPAPGNFILGGALSAATIAETAMAAANIRKESGSTTSGAANINVPAYETLAYETNSNIEGNVRDQRVYVVESDVQTVGQHVDTIESEAQF